MLNDPSNPQLQAEQKLIKAYKSVANTPEGKQVFEDLHTRFLWQDSREHVSAGNALGVVYIDAQRMLLRYIDRKVKMTEDDQLRAYETPPEPNQGDPLGSYGQSHQHRGSGYL